MSIEICARIYFICMLPLSGVWIISEYIYWKQEPYYSKNKKLVDWVEIVLLAHLAITVLNFIITGLICPCIYNDSTYEKANKEDGKEMKKARSKWSCRIAFEMLWINITLLFYYILSIYTVFGIVYITKIQFVGSLWFGFSMISIVVLYMLIAMPFLCMLPCSCCIVAAICDGMFQGVNDDDITIQDAQGKNQQAFYQFSKSMRVNKC